jgi:hypothetical protein
MSLKVQLMVFKLIGDKTGLSFFGIFIIDKPFILTVRNNSFSFEIFFINILFLRC